MDAINTVALTVISACVGANISKMPDNKQTLASVVIIMLGLLLFHRTVIGWAQLLAHRQFKRLIQVAILTAPVGAVIALVTGNFIGNTAVGIGLMLGWVTMFFFAASAGFFPYERAKR